MLQKIALITGGASGIGQATAYKLLKTGFTVICADIHPTTHPDFVSRICDFSKEHEVEELFDWIDHTYGHIDFMLTAAGIHHAKHIADTNLRDFNTVADTNMKGVYLAIRLGVPLMKKANGGCIVTVSSDAGLVPDRDAPLYTASKHWIIGLSKALSLDLIQYGIRVNCVCPGATNTPFLQKAFGNDPQAIAACGKTNPVGRLASPEEVAAVIVSMYEIPYINGAIWNVDGGFSWGGSQEPPKTS